MAVRVVDFQKTRFNMLAVSCHYSEQKCQRHGKTVAFDYHSGWNCSRWQVYAGSGQLPAGASAERHSKSLPPWAGSKDENGASKDSHMKRASKEGDVKSLQVSACSSPVMPCICWILYPGILYHPSCRTEQGLYSDLHSMPARFATCHGEQYSR